MLGAEESNWLSDLSDLAGASLHECSDIYEDDLKVNPYWKPVEGSEGKWPQTQSAGTKGPGDPTVISENN